VGQIGEELRRARELKGLSLRDVEEATKIRMKYLIALEADDFEALPGRVYVIGFLRTYARFLGINDENLVNQVKSLTPVEVHDEELVEKPKPVKKKKKGLIFTVFGALIFLVALAFVFSYLTNPTQDQTGKNDVPQVQTPETQQPEKNEPETQENNDYNNIPDQENEPKISGVSVIVNVKEASCWLDVNIDGADYFTGTLNAGENRTFIGQHSIDIVYGNAGAVEVIYNGKTMEPLGSSGQRVVKEYREE